MRPEHLVGEPEAVFLDARVFHPDGGDGAGGPHSLSGLDVPHVPRSRGQEAELLLMEGAKAQRACRKGRRALPLPLAFPGHLPMRQPRGLDCAVSFGRTGFLTQLCIVA